MTKYQFSCSGGCWLFDTADEADAKRREMIPADASMNHVGRGIYSFSKDGKMLGMIAPCEPVTITFSKFMYEVKCPRWSFTIRYYRETGNCEIGINRRRGLGWQAFRKELKYPIFSYVVIQRGM